MPAALLRLAIGPLGIRTIVVGQQVVDRVGFCWAILVDYALYEALEDVPAFSQPLGWQHVPQHHDTGSAEPGHHPCPGSPAWGGKLTPVAPNLRMLRDQLWEVGERHYHTLYVLKRRV